MKKIHISNAAGRDATVAYHSLRRPPRPRPGLPDREVHFQRYVASAESGLHEEMTARHGEDYAQALIDGDPEVDAELIGRRIEKTDTVYLSSSGEVLYASPRLLEVIQGPDGTERERRPPQDVPANVNDEFPVRWTGRKLPKAEAVRRMVFRRSIQLQHTDGLSYDFLFAMAKELHDEEAMLVVGAGPSGKHPLVFQSNGTPYRGLLEGRVEGDRYKLFLHLSNLELKRPPEDE